MWAGFGGKCSKEILDSTKQIFPPSIISLQWQNSLATWKNINWLFWNLVNWQYLFSMNKIKYKNTLEFKFFNLQKTVWVNPKPALKIIWLWVCDDSLLNKNSNGFSIAFPENIYAFEIIVGLSYLNWEIVMKDCSYSLENNSACRWSRLRDFSGKIKLKVTANSKLRWSL